MTEKIRSTTVIVVRRDNKVVMAGDGQVTFGNEVLKASARKLRRLYNEKVLAGFAGSTADAFSLFARFEAKLEQFNGNLPRSVVELAKDWRTDRVLRHLEAMLVVADAKNTYLVSGNGDVIEPDEGVVAIGSGGPVCHGGGHRPVAQYQDERARHRRAGHADRGQNLHLHQRQRHLRGALTAWSSIYPGKAWMRSRCWMS